MRVYLISLTLLFAAGAALVWNWGLEHRLSYLSRDYAIMTGKLRLLDSAAKPSLAIFGDSAVMDGIQPEKLGPGVLNCAMSGCSPIESYFLVRRLLKGTVRPQAVLLSYNAFHFVHPDFYWENTVKFGLLSGPEADEVLGYILRTNDPELVPKDKDLIAGSGLFSFEERLYSFLLSRGFPSYYMSSLFAEHYGVRKKENDEALDVIAKTRGQYYFPLTDGSKSLNADTRLKTFEVSPVVDHYFRATLELLKKENVPVYFYVMPINESSVAHIEPSVFAAYQSYLKGFAQAGQLRILGKMRTVYPWKLFSDYAHLNQKGTLRFNQEFPKILNDAKVPGGPYGVFAR